MRKSTQAEIERLIEKVRLRVRLYNDQMVARREYVRPPIEKAKERPKE